MNRRPGRDDAEAFQEAWESGTPTAGEVATLVRTAEALCEAAVVEPRVEFRAALRERLMTEAQTVLVPDPGASRRVPAERTHAAVTTAPARGRRRLAGLAVAAVSSLGVVGLVAGSASAIPGDVLYPVKRGVENVELALHRSDDGRGTQRLEIAAERLSEARQVLADGTPSQRSQLPQLLDAFSSQAEQGSAELFGAFGSDGAPSSIDTVNDFAAASAVDLSVMSADVPADAEAAFTSAAAVVTDLAGQASRLCGTCGSADVGSLVGTVATVVRSGADSGSQPADDTRSAADRQPAPSTTRTPASAAAPSTAPPLVQVPLLPSPSSSSKPQGLRAVTDPVLGGLLGDEDTEGLVPGLVNGLLGSGAKK